MTRTEYLRRVIDPKRYGKLDENGADMELIKEALKLKPKQRVRRMDLARRILMRAQRTNK